MHTKYNCYDDQSATSRGRMTAPDINKSSKINATKERLKSEHVFAMGTTQVTMRHLIVIKHLKLK